jgi:putative FmdB family regulatory protein
MPIYRYVCEKCGARTEVIQKISDAPLKRCRTCRGKLEKDVSRTSFQLKGGGWYLTDYASKSATVKADKSEKSTSAKSDAKSEGSTSTDSK